MLHRQRVPEMFGNRFGIQPGRDKLCQVHRGVVELPEVDLQLVSPLDFILRSILVEGYFRVSFHSTNYDA